MHLHLEGATALVTASTRGIGYACASALANEGASVILNGRSQEGVDRAVTALSREFPEARVWGIAADVCAADDVDTLVDAAGDVDILVNNAGMFGITDFAHTSDAEWDEYIQLNLMSGVRLSRALLSGMLARGTGRIIFIASESGVNVPADMIPYGVSKAAMIALANGLAKTTRGTGVTVNTVVGGPTYSDGVAAAIQGIAQAQDAEPEAVKAQIMDQHPTTLVGRFLEPEEIASLVAYLASPVASATNGAALRADGGALTAVL